MTAVLDATLEELGRVGFAALSVEEVARQAGVNKTTVYRRWPTKPELVQAAFERFGAAVPVIDTGTLEGDLCLLLRTKLRLARTPRGRSLVRALLAEAMTPGVLEVSRRLREREVELYRAIFARARRRGELRPGLSDELLMAAVEGPLAYRFLARQRLSTYAEARQAVALVLRGALLRR